MFRTAIRIFIRTGDMEVWGNGINLNITANSIDTKGPEAAIFANSHSETLGYLLPSLRYFSSVTSYVLITGKYSKPFENSVIIKGNIAPSFIGLLRYAFVDIQYLFISMNLIFREQPCK